MDKKVTTVVKFLNLLTKKGQKSKAINILLKMLYLLKKKTKKKPISLVYSLVKTLTPGVTTKKTVIAGRLYHLPAAITKNKALYYGCHWLQKAAVETKEGKSAVFSEKLSNEFLRVLKKKGQSFLFLKQHNKVVSDNRPFLRFVRRKYKPRLPRKVFLKRKQLLYLKNRKKPKKRKFVDTYNIRVTPNKIKKVTTRLDKRLKSFYPKARRVVFNINKRFNKKLKYIKAKAKMPSTEETKKKAFYKLKKLFRKYKPYDYKNKKINKKNKLRRR